MEDIKYNRLKVIKEIEPYISPKGNKIKKVLCECDCGNKTEVSLNAIMTNKIKSCGCLFKEGNNTKHNKRYTAEYLTWIRIKTRCYNEKNDNYRYYGGRGIEVCDKWINSFQDFFNDMGEKPSPEYSIDRINPNGNYEPINCRWATKIQQANNKRKKYE
jgi:hypothetical protein